jgi:hypothetical protein
MLNYQMIDQLWWHERTSMDSITPA